MKNVISRLAQLARTLCPAIPAQGHELKLLLFRNFNIFVTVIFSVPVQLISFLPGRHISAMNTSFCLAQTSDGLVSLTQKIPETIDFSIGHLGFSFSKWELKTDHECLQLPFFLTRSKFCSAGLKKKTYTGRSSF